MAANAGSQGLMLKVWAGLLALTLIEVLLAYVHVAPGLMLALVWIRFFRETPPGRVTSRPTALTMPVETVLV